MPLPLQQQVDILYPSIVSVMQSFGQMLLQVRLKVLVGFLTLEQRTKLTGVLSYRTFTELQLLRNTYGQICYDSLRII